MKSTLTNFISALFICIVVFVGYGVWYATIASKSTAVANLQNQITTTTENASRAASTRAAFAEIADNETTVQNYFISETGVVLFIDDLETRGRSQGTTINVLSVSTGGTLKQPVFVFSLTVRGTFDAVMRTVGIIEYAPYDISISSLSLNQEAQNAWRADLQLVVGSVPANTKKSTYITPARYAYF